MVHFKLRGVVLFAPPVLARPLPRIDEEDCPGRHPWWMMFFGGSTIIYVGIKPSKQMW